ncbi:Apple-like protein [Artemisia annua]|uniref:Apple-like protein n=1 Tax=Artemisia annua TaxID=35608 RepID=A0A2U1PD85_ARTAN|nr:Apple-like protein [Artemisia annua]
MGHKRIMSMGQPNPSCLVLTRNDRSILPPLILCSRLLIMVYTERINRELLEFDSISTTSGDANNNTELVSFSLRSVLAATGSFSVKNKLGEGGFGPVYKV